MTQEAFEDPHHEMKKSRSFSPMKFGLGSTNNGSPPPVHSYVNTLSIQKPNLECLKLQKAQSEDVSPSDLKDMKRNTFVNRIVEKTFKEKSDDIMNSKILLLNDQSTQFSDNYQFKQA